MRGVVFHLELVLNFYAPDELRTYLKELRLTPGAHIPLTAKSTHSLNLDAFLMQLSRQGYLDRQKIGAKKSGGGKRGRGSAATQDDGANLWEWKWGPRAHAEVGEVNIATFLAEFMVQKPGEAEDDEDEGDDGAADMQKKFDAVYNAIGRAAGDALTEIR